MPLSRIFDGHHKEKTGPGGASQWSPRNHRALKRRERGGGGGGETETERERGTERRQTIFKQILSTYKFCVCSFILGCVLEFGVLGFFVNTRSLRLIRYSDIFPIFLPLNLSLVPTLCV